MGKAARFACIITPMLCSIASLICVLLLLLAGTTKNFNALEDIYITRVDVRNITTGSASNTIVSSFFDKVTNGLHKRDDDLELQDFYSSYLWTYCYGDVENKDKGEDYNTKGCSKTSVSYVFDIEKIVDDGVGDSNKVNFPENVQKVQKGVAAISKAMIACYVIGFVATVVTAVVGWFGLLSRWGSCVTTIFADVAFFFLLIASSCATFLTYSLHGAFNKAFDEFGVDAKVGIKWMQITWIATACAFVAGFFWLLSTCCCSGRTSRIVGETKGKGSGNPLNMKSTPYTYERVASPYMGASGNKDNVPMTPYGQTPTYEPMRHQQV